LQFHKPYSLDTIPVPRDLEPYDLLLRTAVASYCHTDSMIAEGRLVPLVSKPTNCAGSHEPTGTIVGVGSSAGDLGFQLGNRVAAIGTKGLCGDCDDCKGPEEFRHYCANSKGFVGVNLPGAFQDYVVVDARSATVIPDGVSFATAAPLTCAGVTAWRAVIVATKDLKKGDWIGMIGSGGGLGHLAVQFAAKKGFKVIGLDVREVSLKLTKDMGAEAAIDASVGTEKIVEEVKKVTGGSLVSSVIVFSDHEDATAVACDIIAMHKTVVQIAQPPRVSIPYHHFIFRDIKIVSSLLSSSAQFADLLEFVEKEKVTVMIRKYHKLENLPQIIEDAHSRKYPGKLVLVLDEKAAEEDEQKKRV
jgi:propanol-preferring alcohol dehydrogenase